MTKEYYRRNLPHIQPLGGTFFVTFRLKDSIPLKVLELFRKEYDQAVDHTIKSPSPLKNQAIYEIKKKFFAKYDDILDSKAIGPTYLSQNAISKIVADILLRFDGVFYDLIAYCIMPNHVHILIDSSMNSDDSNQHDEEKQHIPLQVIMKRIKGSSAVRANKELKRSGKFWQRESFDHLVRNDEELDRIYWYILNNPVKAKLVKRWQDHPFTYGKFTSSAN